MTQAINKTSKSRIKAPVQAMYDQRKLEVIAQFNDDVLSKLADAFFQVVKLEGWGKRDLSQISGINETAIGHILAGRRRNLTTETIALLTRAMRKRPELTLHDIRPVGNKLAAQSGAAQVQSAANADQETQSQAYGASMGANIAPQKGQSTNASSLQEVFP